MHMRWMLDATHKTFKTCEVVRISGGSAISPYICQVLADVIGCEIEAIENPRYVGATGAAGLMALSFGLISDIKEIKNFIKIQDSYQPNMANTAVYDKIFPVFKNLYKDNKKSFEILNS